MLKRKATYQKQRKAYRSSLASARSYVASQAMLVAKKRFLRKPLPGAYKSTGRELKAVDVPFAVYNFLSAGSPSLLANGIQVGAGFFNRVGSKVEMVNLHLRGFISNNATCLVQGLRMLVIYDRQPNGAMPTINDILQSRQDTGVATNSNMSEINLDQRDRYIILRDKMWYAPPCTNTAGVLTNGPSFPGNQLCSFEINEFIKLKGLTTHYKASSNPAVIGDINTGALYVYFGTTGVTGNWAANVSSRLRFYDN